MAWCESHTVLLRHRKTVSLAVALGIKPVQAVGHLTVLWHSALEQAEDGDLSTWGAGFIAATACWEGDADAFYSALVAHGWLTAEGLLHDWLDYTGRYLRDKYHARNREKLVAIWAKHERVYNEKGECTPTVHRQPVLPDRPDQTDQPNRDTCPHQEIVALYHNILPELPAVGKWTPPRQAFLRGRWAEDKERQALPWWEAFFKAVKASDFLCGRVNNWKADLEWLVRPTNFIKVVEGRYTTHNKNGGAAPVGSKYSDFGKKV